MSYRFVSCVIFTAYKGRFLKDPTSIRQNVAVGENPNFTPSCAHVQASFLRSPKVVPSVLLLALLCVGLIHLNTRPEKTNYQVSRGRKVCLGYPLSSRLTLAHCLQFSAIAIQRSFSRPCEPWVLWLPQGKIEQLDFTSAQTKFLTGLARKKTNARQNVGCFSIFPSRVV